jgi:signal transduction histidine kinase
MDDALDFRLLFEESPDILLVLLPDAPLFTMVAATKARLEVTHMTREQTIGRGLFEVFPDNPDDPAATGMSNLRASLGRVLATRLPDTMAVQKYDIRGPDGDFIVRYWSPKNIPVLSNAGEIVYILHCVEDVTELVRSAELGDELRDRTREMEREVLQRSRELAAANNDLRAANVKLGELDTAKTAFFSNISHEFRTPLTLMLGPLEDCMADTKKPLGPEQKARLTLAHDNSLRLLKLVNTLLDFSRIEAGRMRACYAPLDIAAFTAELAGMFQSAAERANLTMQIECPPLSGPLWIDREMWEKIVPNLISNAFKFTFEGKIAIRLTENSSHAVLEVADTGVGIPEAELPKIFDRFHRVAGQKGRAHEGTGIGLSLVRELVEIHGGSVSVKSTVGKGTTFRIEIPKGFAHLPPDAVSQTPVEPEAGRDVAAHAAEATRWIGGPVNEEDAPEVSPTTQTAPRARVLVVDDNADLRKYLTGLLSPEYDVTTADDGLSALDEVRANMPEIVVSDVMMPRLDGFGLLRELRENPNTNTLPIILLSARAGEEAAIEGLDAGSDDYLVKPFTARELLVRVRAHIELARMRRAWILELEHANSELDTFSYSVSHDLRAPLRSINGFCQALLDDYEERLDERGKDYLKRVRNAAKHMGELIDGLLALARVARSDLQRERVDLSQLANDVGTMLRATWPGRHVDFHVQDGLEADGDPRLLKAVLENLLGNAWKYSSKIKDARVEVVCVNSNDGQTFCIRDNGAGFDMTYASKLFGPFQRLHSAEEFEGTGIGLATVQRIIQRHGGKIWAEGSPGNGASFYFTLNGPKSGNPLH